LEQRLKPLIGFGLIISFIIFDQISKWLVLEKIFKPELNAEPLGFFNWIFSSDRLPFISLDILPFFNLTMVWNQGISFGLFQSGNPWPLIIIAGLISTLFSVWLYRTKSWLEAVSLSMVIGGAIGNIIDRLHFGAVADFFDFYIGDWHYPAFNIADSLISVGIVMLVVNSLFFNQNNKKSS
jgi:signal peptidase II